MEGHVHRKVYPHERVVVRLSKATDAVILAPRLRAADAAEVRALGKRPIEALIDGFRHSAQCLTIERSGRPCAMFGVVPAELDGLHVGVVWLLGSDELLCFRRLFLRESRAWLDEISQGYDLLANIIDERNTVHIRWLRWLGFSLLGPHTIFGSSFIEFVCIPHV